MNRLIRFALFAGPFANFFVPALASSPIPTFDKEAVTERPYMRSGEELSSGKIGSVVGGGESISEIPRGNTGTESDPAFYIHSIRLIGYPIEDPYGTLRSRLSEFSNRSVKVSDLALITNTVMNYCREIGITVPLAVIPPQEVREGVLEIRVYAATYDKVGISLNESDVQSKWLEGYIEDLKPGDTIKDSPLEHVINNINDIPGAEAKALLKPGATPGTTALDIEVRERTTKNNYVFIDNSGSHYSGRYHLGVNFELPNLIGIGDRFMITGSVSDEETTNYSVRYEFPLFHEGTRLGIAFSQTNYDISTFTSLYDSKGESRGISLYGLTPIYRSKAARATLIYGYDHRDITDEYNFNEPILRPFDFSYDKIANVWHLGLSGSHYAPNQFLQYSLIYWFGHINTKGTEAYYDGNYHKLTADLLKVWYVDKWNFRINARGQLANRALDSSEQFFMGGVSGMRAYANGDGYGDSAYIISGELRRATFIPGLEAAVFVDYGVAKSRSTAQYDHLTDAGIGFRYVKDNDWYANFDFAHKIDGRADLSEPGDNDYRLWFQIYKMF